MAGCVLEEAVVAVAVAFAVSVGAAFVVRGTVKLLVDLVQRSYYC